MRTKLAFLTLLGAALLWPMVATAQGKPAAGPKVGGYMQADFYAGDDPGTGADTSFFLRRVRIGVSGDIAKTIVSYGFTGGFDGGNSPTSASSANLLDAWINLKFDPLFQVRAGQFKYTFDREGKESGSAIPFAMRSAITRDMAEHLGLGGGSFRAIGLEVHGASKTPVAWKYALGVVNGNGINRTDDNDDKDVYLRGEIEPVKGLSFGAGYTTGRYRSGTPPVDRTDSAWTIDAQYHVGPFAIRGAYYAGEYKTAGVSKEPDGWYVVGSYKILPNLDLLLRYQQYDADTNVGNNTFDSFDVGVNYYFARKGAWGGTKLVLNYMFRDCDAGCTGGVTNRVWYERGATLSSGTAVDDVFIARLQVAF
jgi:phosphate-selective porin